MKKVYKYIGVGILMLGLSTNIINIQDSVKVQAKKHDMSYTSYNPTEPEKRLGKVTKLDIDESGTVSLNKHNAQGALDKNGDVYIDAVKRPTKPRDRFLDEDMSRVYYIVDKDGDIFSAKIYTNGYIESTDGTQVQLHIVDMLEGRNGLADGDGFKSNLVPERFLPKTGEGEVVKTDNEYSIDEINYGVKKLDERVLSLLMKKEPQNIFNFKGGY